MMKKKIIIINIILFIGKKRDVRCDKINFYTRVISVLTRIYVEYFVVWWWHCYAPKDYRVDYRKDLERTVLRTRMFGRLRVFLWDCLWMLDARVEGVGIFRTLMKCSITGMDGGEVLDKVDVRSNDTMIIISGTLKSIPLTWLQFLSNIAPTQCWTKTENCWKTVKNKLLNTDSRTYPI